MTSAATLPFSIEAERAVLGSCLLSREALASAIEILKPDDFYEVRHRLAFEVLADMYVASKPADMVTFSDELSKRDIFDRLGGTYFINQLVNDVATTANVAYYCDIVHERSVRRKIIEATHRIEAIAADTSKELTEILEEAEKLFYEAGQNKDSSDFRHVREIIGPVFTKIEASLRETGSHLTGYPTGYTDLDAMLGGLQPGSLNIIAARPSMGKTALAMNIAQFGGGMSTNNPVLVFSLEMPAEQLVQRMISAESRIDLSELSRGTFDTTAFKMVREACDVLATRNIFINDTTTLSAMEFRARCRRFKMRHPDLALVIVDYLQLMSYSEKRNEGRQQEVSDISRMLKAAAREINCPVIALSQLSREAEKRTDKKPQLSDLRDSGAIEQDADTVMMLYREDYYTEHEDNSETDSKADVRVAKNRNGGTGVIHLTFRREITRFFNFGEA